MQSRHNFSLESEKQAEKVVCLGFRLTISCNLKFSNNFHLETSRLLSTSIGNLRTTDNKLHFVNSTC